MSAIDPVGSHISEHDLARIKQEMAAIEARLEELRSRIPGQPPKPLAESRSIPDNQPASHDKSQDTAQAGTPVLGGDLNNRFTVTAWDSADQTITLYLTNASTSLDTGATVLEANAAYTADGVNGLSNTGIGVSGFSLKGVGVFAASSDGTGLQAKSSGSSSAIFAESSANNATTITAMQSSPQGGYGLLAMSANGIGIVAAGGRSPLQLLPHSSQEGPPQSGSHSAGELFLDSKIDLYLCKAPGTPGTWKLIG